MDIDYPDNSDEEEKEEYEQLNNYILKETIGQGSYGTVRICTDQNTQTEYAIKIISKKRIKAKAGFSGRKQLGPRGSPRAPPGRQALGGGNNPLAGIQREIAILKKCHHANIVCLKEVIDDNESPEQNIYLVFELMDRGTVCEEPNMSNRDQVPPLPEADCRGFARDLLLGLEYLHYQKIVHRDIKPSNLLLSSDNHLKIADFGVSEIFEGDRAILKNSAGSPAFLPPEAVDPDIKIFDGQLLDIWATGITLYIFAFGRVPFVGKSILELHDNIRTQTLTFPDTPNATEPLKDLLNKLLCKDPAERISVAAAKNHPWITNNNTEPIPSTAENCDLVEVTDADVANAVTCIKWGTMLVLYNIARHRSFKLRSDSRRPPSNNVEDSMDDLKLQEPQNT